MKVDSIESKLNPQKFRESSFDVRVSELRCFSLSFLLIGPENWRYFISN